MVKKIKNYLELFVNSVFVVWSASKKLTIALFVLIVCQALSPVLMVNSVKWIVDAVSDGTVENIGKLVLPLLMWILAYAYSTMSSPLMKNIEGTLSDKLIEHINIRMMKKSKSIEGIELFENADFYNDIEFISEQAAWRPINLVIFGSGLIQNAITIISFAILLANYSPVLSLIIIGVNIPNSYYSFKIQQEAFESMVMGSENVREMQYFSDILLSSEFAKEARIYDYFDYFIMKYKNTYDQNHQRIMKSRFKKMNYSVVFSSINIIVSLLALLWMINEVIQGNFLLGVLVAFTNIIYYIGQNMDSMIEHSTMLYDTLLYMDKFFAFLDRDESRVADNQIKFSTFDAIEFKDLSFCYPNSQTYALNDISIKVDKGQKIAIVGENGSGKSTLVKLLSRFYDVDEGSILFDGVDYRNYDIKLFRKHFSAVYQDFGKYDLTLRENIAFGDLSYLNDDAKLISVVDQAGLKTPFEKFDSDLDQILGTKFENSKNLSGGEWQKVAIARALLSNREIVILDEPTAALDPRSEFEIYEKLLNLMEGKTVFFVTHRLSAVKLAHKVLVLKGGKVEAFDTHSNLMSTNSYYREMYDMQASGFIF